MINVRVFYHKTGRAKYISHLDIMRCMQRAVVRAGLPVWYTEGFNPHIYLTFSLPLSLGYESESEVMDFRLVDDTYPFDEVTVRLNRSLPPDIRVVRAASPVNKPEGIVSAVYEIKASVPGCSGTALGKAFRAFMEQKEILVEKRAKKGARKIMKEIDIRPLCELLSCEETGAGLLIRLKTAAGIQTNLNPALLLDAFCAYLQTEALSYSVCRKSLLLADGTDFC